MTMQQLLTQIASRQNRLHMFNNALDNPNIKREELESLEAKKKTVLREWYDLMCDYHAHPDYNGNNSFQKENNPY